MDNYKFAQILDQKLRANPSEVFDRLGTEVIAQILSDSESPKSIGKELLAAYNQSPTITDKVLIGLCGWSMKSLLTFAEIITDDEGLIIND